MIDVAELVLDANIFAHSNNPDHELFTSAVALLRGVVESVITLAFDNTGKRGTVEFDSHLYREVVGCISPASFAYSALVSLIATDRIKLYPKPQRGVHQTCKVLVPANAIDALVLGVATQTPDRILITNDYLDFPIAVRTAIAKKLGVRVYDSEEAAAG